MRVSVHARWGDFEQMVVSTGFYLRRHAYLALSRVHVYLLENGMQPNPATSVPERPRNVALYAQVSKYQVSELWCDQGRQE